ncbi:DUF4377 domain-containing protein [Psychrobium sp. 1_MG-2023]|uniref:DUF4377 domain-containing protein n=1 Tax=Psychrobium sp. 1_MG-2023 TaxID=3062624 RepID=UPI000C3339A1|nr:DUF4377 domain-containing protein [Psychrobium sp. 1_MG-2023]MDP2561587.1 DUF4377 domain-containing protein [Psychrobium sp. 1_MG-2023]PKF55046.1 hypothetical protein CW748_14820 [Alteromonadales bacterium alter-6D02]
MNKKYINVIASTFLFFGLIACQSTPREEQQVVTVAPFKVSCVGVANQQCLNVLVEDEWQLFYQRIDGFNFSEGHYQTIKINKVPRTSVAADQSTVDYQFISLISRAKQVFLPKSMLTAKRQWQLKSVSTIDDLLSHPGFTAIDQKPYLTLSNEGLTGFSGCNRFFSSVVNSFESNEFSTSHLAFSTLGSSMKACYPNTIGQIERAMLNALYDTDQFVVNWPELIFYSKGKQVASFVASDWD